MSDEIKEEEKPQSISVKDLVPVSCRDDHIDMFLDTNLYNQSFRAANMLAKGHGMIPKEYAGNATNCMLALSMAKTLGITPYMFLQWSYFIHGKVGLESKALIAIANKSPLFEAGILFEEVGEKGKDSWGIKAYAEDVQKGRIEEICTIQTAKDAGWWSKKDSWWPKNPNMMCKYRAASFLVKFNRPELLGGMAVYEELRDEGAVDITDKANAAMAKEKSGFAQAVDMAKKEEPAPKKTAAKKPKPAPEKASDDPPESKPETPKKTAAKPKEVRELLRVWRLPKNKEAIDALIESGDFSLEEFDNITLNNLRGAASNWMIKIRDYNKKSNGNGRDKSLPPIITDLKNARKAPENKAAAAYLLKEKGLNAELMMEIEKNKDVVAASGWLLKIDEYNSENPPKQSENDDYQGEQEPPPGL
jgi:hypothetical protein